MELPAGAFSCSASEDDVEAGATGGDEGTPLLLSTLGERAAALGDAARLGDRTPRSGDASPAAGGAPDFRLAGEASD